MTSWLITWALASVVGFVTGFMWSRFRRRRAQRPSPGEWLITTNDCTPAELSAMVYLQTRADYVNAVQRGPWTFEVRAHWKDAK